MNAISGGLVGLGLLFAFFGWVLLYRKRRETADWDRTISALTMRPIASAVGDGVHAVRGRVEADETFALPFDDETPAAYCALRVLGEPTATQAPKTLFEQARGERLRIVDRSGEAVVELSHAYVALEDNSYVYRGALAEGTPLARYLEGVELDEADVAGKLLEVHCRWVAPDDEVLVIGETHTEQRETTTGYRGGSTTTPVFASTGGFQLQVVSGELDAYQRGQLSAGHTMERAGRGLLALALVVWGFAALAALR